MPQEVVLHCKVHPAAVTLLSSLTRLRTVTIRLGMDYDGEDENPYVERGAWTASSVATCVTPLLLCTQHVQSVSFELWESDDEELNRALNEGVERVRSSLRIMGRDPNCINMIGY